MSFELTKVYRLNLVATLAIHACFSVQRFAKLEGNATSAWSVILRSLQ